LPVTQLCTVAHRLITIAQLDICASRTHPIVLISDWK